MTTISAAPGVNYHTKDAFPSSGSPSPDLDSGSVSPLSVPQTDFPSNGTNKIEDSRGNNRPTPLPAFVFPLKSPTNLQAAPRSAPASFSRASGRRPMSAIELNGPVDRTDLGNTRPSLPDFSFGNTQSQSPPVSPRDIPSRPGFHKRGTSEFIGGDGKTGKGLGLMSTSPTKGDNVLPAPTPTSFGGPPAGRRGHAHRRSAAMSCHDLSMILKPDPTVLKGGASAPTSPSVENHNIPPFSGSSQTVEAKTPPADDLETPAKPINRARVGFSEVVDIIPRPLSLVSSDSASTARQGHSVSNSMSSIVSAGASSPQPKEKRGQSLSPNQDIPAIRPRTAEPILTGSETPEGPRRRNSIPLLAEAATTSSSVPSTPRSAKKWGFFGQEDAPAERSPKLRPTSSASVDAAQTLQTSTSEEGGHSHDTLFEDNVLHTTDSRNSRRSSTSRKPGKKQKKVRTWAGSILSRKSRQRSQKHKLNRRSPTPPLRAYTEEQQSYAFNEYQSEPVESPSSTMDVQTDFNSWKPRKSPIQEEAMSPMIDLDAALGPFNTPSGSRFGDDWDASQRNGVKKRAMHSAMSNTYYHRRAESAPEFENPRFGLHRLGSSSTMGMEDVFEEENEDEEWEDAKASDKDSVARSAGEEEESGLGIDIKVVDSDGLESGKSMDFQDASFVRGIKRKGSGLSETERWNLSSAKSEHSNRSVLDEPIIEESSPVEFAAENSALRSDSGSKSSDATITPPLRSAAKELSPVDIQPFSLQPPYPTPTSPRSATQSSFPSPRSPFSYDTQRISTAPSSVNDEQGFQSLLLGEPGPEVRMSVDGDPSLTSSGSTMTRDSGIPVASPNFQLREGQRSSSMSSVAMSRKRSSMASLSRLISSSHGEKSKLSIETRPSTSEGIEKKEKPSRGKRISRLMQFWRPKDA